jgi:hypothetical protein
MQKKTYKSAMGLPKEFGTEEFCLSDFMCCKRHTKYNELVPGIWNF